MNIENLEVGMVVKNYKAMCELLCEDVQAGNSKKAQIKEWERHFKYTKEGNKFIIEEVYELVKFKEDGRKTGKSNVYGELAQILLIDKLANAKSRTITISKSKLIRDLSLANENYTGCKSDLRKFSKYIGIDISYIYDFYNVNDSSFTGIITRALNNLQDKKIISYSTKYKIKVYGGNNRLMTDEEEYLMIKCERETLKELGFKKVSEVRKTNKWKLYNSLALTKLREHLSVEYYYQAYHIIINDEYLEEERLDLINEIKSKSYRDMKHEEMNKLVVSEFNKRLTNKINDDNGKNLEFKRNDEYESNNLKLSKVLLDKNSENILSEVYKTELKDEYNIVNDSSLPF